MAIEPKRLILTLCLIPIALIVAYCTRPSEPKYQGKTLTELLVMLRDPEAMSPNINPSNAIRAMGQRAIPALLEMVGTEEVGPIEAEKIGVETDSEPAAACRKRELACRGFEVLGPTAGPAVPQLSKLLANTNVAAEAVWALRAIGPDSAGVLAKAATNRNVLARTWAIIALGQLGSNHHGAASALIPCLSDGDFRIRIVTATSLGQLHQEPAVVLPLLSNLLADPYDPVRRAAISALSGFGVNGKPTHPWSNEPTNSSPKP